MTRNEARIQNLANLLAGATGLALFATKYLSQSPDPYSNLGNPWEATAHNSHVLLSPLLLFAVGLIWADHVWKKLYKHRQRRRRSGVMIALLFPPMAITAYLIQITVHPVWRQAWANIHIVASVLWIGGYAAHLITKPRS